MKKIELKQNVNYAHKYPNDNNSYSIIDGKTYNTIQVTSDPTNCKLSYIHNIGIIINCNNDDRKQIINDLLKICKGCVILNTTSEAVAEFIKNNYEVYYYQEVPIGYEGRFQYHICIRNLIVINHNCRKPSNFNNIKTIFDLDTIATKLRILLRRKRRKDDYVDEFINELK